jgi:hypothetical protein|tara:strand:- start:544 stop:1098 length:555 start_codon:yes stop_codon:yes gene_type:complete
MHKKVLSEIDLYYGEVVTPKGFEINREKIKNDIINSYVTDKKMSNNPKDYAAADFKVPFSQPLQWFQDYIRDHWRVEYERTLVPKSLWGNVFDYNQKSFTRNNVDPVDLRNSPDYTLIYGIDIGEDKENGVVIEYDNNRRKGGTWHMPIKNNHFIMFPSTNRYFISPNKSKRLNTYLTITYEYI